MTFSMKEQGASAVSSKVTLSVCQDFTVLGAGAAKQLLAEYAVFGEVSAAGNYVYRGIATLSSGALNTYAPTVVFSGAGGDEYLICKITDASSGANSYAIGILEYL